MLDPAHRLSEAAHFDGEALDGAVEADGDPGQDGDLVLNRADPVENAVELAGEEVEGDVGHARDYARLDACWPAVSDLDGRIVDQSRRAFRSAAVATGGDRVAGLRRPSASLAPARRSNRRRLFGLA